MPDDTPPDALVVIDSLPSSEFGRVDPDRVLVIGRQYRDVERMQEVIAAMTKMAEGIKALVPKAHPVAPTFGLDLLAPYRLSKLRSPDLFDFDMPVFVSPELRQSDILDRVRAMAVPDSEPTGIPRFTEALRELAGSGPPSVKAEMVMCLHARDKDSDAPVIFEEKKSRAHWQPGPQKWGWKNKR